MWKPAPSVPRELAEALDDEGVLLRHDDGRLREDDDDQNGEGCGDEECSGHGDLLRCERIRSAPV